MSDYSKKGSILAIINVLKEYSDEDHFLTQNDIILYVERKYNITINRKTVSSSIKLLEDYGYDIQHSNKNGVALVGRLFDDTQLQYLIDFVYSSHSIGSSDAKKLIHILENTLSIYQRSTYKEIYKNFEGSRTDNKEVFYNVMVILEAIALKKKVKFTYMKYDIDGNLIPRREKPYLVSPYYLVNNAGKYYLISVVASYPNIFSFRVDFMKDIVQTEYKAVSMSSIPTMKNFDYQSYLSSHIYMMGEKEILVKLELQDENACTPVYDWFGKKAICYKKDDKIIAEIKTAEDNIVYWALQYSDKVKIISPESTVNKIKSMVEKLKDNYQGC